MKTMKKTMTLVVAVTFLWGGMLSSVWAADCTSRAESESYLQERSITYSDSDGRRIKDTTRGIGTRSSAGVDCSKEGGSDGAGALAGGALVLTGVVLWLYAGEKRLGLMESEEQVDLMEGLPHFTYDSESEQGWLRWSLEF